MQGHCHTLQKDHVSTLTLNVKAKQNKKIQSFQAKPSQVKVLHHRPTPSEIRGTLLLSILFTIGILPSQTVDMLNIEEGSGACSACRLGISSRGALSSSIDLLSELPGIAGPAAFDDDDEAAAGADTAGPAAFDDEDEAETSAGELAAKESTGSQAGR